ncbi:hypothetical protein EV380_2343 [Zhihengliuella halotolerans]|uniref:Uncharacterized protein n=1 Tax=Zhihengliuella halotolerans TaxID=370736 RepID=A0A4Q8AFX0_9MICC|nr:hypothetical protein EV380_2343 [Zhihengliuella halotolerans]
MLREVGSTGLVRPALRDLNARIAEFEESLPRRGSRIQASKQGSARISSGTAARIVHVEAELFRDGQHLLIMAGQGHGGTE